MLDFFLKDDGSEKNEYLTGLTLEDYHRLRELWAMCRSVGVEISFFEDALVPFEKVQILNRLLISFLEKSHANPSAKQLLDAVEKVMNRKASLCIICD